MENQTRDIGESNKGGIGDSTAPVAGRVTFAGRLRAAIAVFLTITSVIFCAESVSAASYNMQGQAPGNTNWINGPNLNGWAELDCIPMRIQITAGPVSNVVINVNFPRDNGGSPPISGVQDLYNWLGTTNLIFVSPPTLTTNTGSSWNYSMTVTVTNNIEADITFCARLASGSHNYPGSSLHVDSTVNGGALGSMHLSKPASGSGTPDLSVVKTGPTLINAGSFVTYTVTYSNTTASSAGGVQITDFLPTNATYVSCSGGCTGNTNNLSIVWDLGLLAKGASGVVSYTMFVSGSAPNGSTIVNTATISTVDNDPVSGNNSSTVTSTVTNGCVAPTIGSQPLAATACPGSSATFTVGANGSTPYAYQWRKNGASISLATNSFYTVAAASASDAASYSVIVTNICGSVTSAAVTLTVNTATTASALTNQTVCPGNNVVFSTTASGTGPFTYQWQKNGSNLPPQTNSSITLTGVSSVDAATYNVIVTGTCNSVTNTATLTVNTTISSTGLVSITNNCSGTTAAFTESVTGSGPLTFVWKKNGSVISGQTSSAFIIASTSTNDNGSYTVEVTGPCNNITNSASLTVSTGTFGTALTSLTNCPGTTATFSTTASGAGPFSYKWRRNGLLLFGTTNSLTVGPVTNSDAGTYTVEITGSCNVITNAATLTVNTPLTVGSMASQTTCVGQSVTFSVSPTGSGPLVYTWKKNGVVQGSTSNTLTIVSAAPSDNGTYLVQVDGPCNSVANSASLTVNDLTTASALTNLVLCPGQAATFSTVASGTGPFTYVWKKNGVALGSTNSALTVASVSSGDAGTYSVEVAGACSSVTNSATLSVNTPTTASALINQTNCPGYSVTFSTAASGTGPFSYLWRKDGVVQSSTSNSLAVASITSSDAGSYTVEVMGTCNSVTNTGTLTVNSATTASSITSLVVCPGQPAAFTTLASGTGPFTYVWKKDGVVQSSTLPTLTIASATSADAGTYTVEVTGTCNSVTNSATLTVNDPTIATALVSVTNCPGQSATFSTVVSGTGPFTYVWKKDGAVQSSTTNTLAISSVAAADAGTYTVEVNGTCNSVTNNATLTVNQNTSASGLADVVQCTGKTATFTTVASGTGPFTYVWKKDGVVQANTTDTLTIPAVTSTDAGAYTVEVTGACNSVTNSATLTVNDSTVATSLTSLVVCPGQSAMFTTAASGTGPFTYVWKKDGIVQSSTTDTLSIASATSADAGTYTVEVAGTCNAVTNEATLTVNQVTDASALTNLVVCAGQSATFSTIPSGSGPFTYVWKKDGLVQSSTTNSLTVNFASSTDAGSYTVEVAGACTSVTNTAMLTVNDNTAATSLSDLVLCPGSQAIFTTTPSGTGPFTYVWKKDGVIQSVTNNTLTIASVTATDGGTYTVEVTGTCNTVTNSASLTVNTPTTASPLTDIVTCGQAATFTTIAGGTGPFSYIWKKNGVVQNSTSNSLTIPSVAAGDAGTYTVEVTGVCNSVTNNATLTLNADTAVTPLNDLILCPGQTATFSTLATGSGPFTYVWKKDGVVQSSTNDSLTIASVASGDAGTYTIEVTGACNSVTNTATLTVNTPTTSSALISLVVCPAQSATFTTVASGTGPFVYVWKKDGVIQVSTTNSLTIASATASDAGSYTVEVTGTCNSVTNTATLTVNENTSVTSLIDLVLCPDETATFTTTASGTGPFAYVWKKDGTVIDGQTTNSLSIDAITAANAGTYTVEVTGVCNSVTKSATLTVNEIVSASASSDVVVCENQSAAFSTTASGTGPFNYVWKKDGQVLNGQTDSSINIASAQVGDAGTYAVEVTGVCTSVTNSATLMVNRLTATSDLTTLVLCPGQDATFSTVTSGTGPFSYAWSKDGQPLSGETTDHITISGVTAANAGTYSVHVTGTCNSADKSATLTVNENTSATELTSLVVCPGETATFTTTVSGTGPFSFVWKKDGVVVDNEMTNSLTLSNVAAANGGSYTVEVSGLCTSVTNTATLTVNEIVSATPLTDVVICENQPAAFATAASGTGPFSYVWKKDGLVLNGQIDSSITIASAQVADAGTYTVEVTGVCTSVTNSATLTVNRLTGARELASLIVCPGQSATFSTIPSGTGPFSYAWTKDGQPISGETTDHITIDSAVAANAGTYSVHVTGTCNSVDKSATLTVNENTSATSLTSLVLCPGQTATFSTVASGTGPFTYVWKKDGVVQSSASDTLTVNSVASSDAGTYSVEISGTCTSVTNSATLTVNVNTSATSLSSLVLCPGQPATFTTVASGTGPFTYVWKKDGIAQGSTSNALTIDSISSTDAGTYTVEITGTCTSVTNAATLTVNENTAASSLTDLVLCPGQNATFTSTVSGTGPFGFVWRKDGVVINGETTNTLTLNGVTALSAGTYTLEVTGVCTSVTNSASLAVNENVSSSSLTNLIVCQGQPATFTAFPAGTGPFQFVWKKDGIVLPAETQNSLNIASADVGDAATYTVEVTGTCTSVTNSATLTVNLTTATSDLASLVVCPGNTATFTTIPSGTGPFTYIWSKDGQPIGGETDDHITLNNVTAANAGTYTVHVTGTCNSADKSATLTVNENTSATSLSDLVLCPGETATFTTTVSGTGPFGYVWKKDGVVIDGQTTNTLAVASVAAANAGTYTVEVTGVCTSATNSATLTVNEVVSATALADAVVCQGQPASFSTTASGTGPFSYVWKQNGNVLGGETGSSISIAAADVVNAGTYTVEVTGVCTSVTNSATLTVNILTSTSDLTSLTLCPGQDATFTTVPIGTGPFTFVWTKDGQTILGETTDHLTITSVTAANSGSYSVHVTGTCNSVEAGAMLTVNTNTATTSLTSLVLCPGQTATFTTIASGTGPFNYVWKKDGIIQSSASNSLSIASVASGDAGQYTVEVTGTCTSVTNSATLVVNTNTSSTSLTDLVLCPGQDATFATVASGTGPFSYVWKKDGSVIVGETTNTITVSSILAVNAGTYTVEITGLCTSVTNNATLTVNTNTSASSLTSFVLCPGQTATFSTVASGTGPFGYVWKKDGAIIDGEVTNTLTVSNVIAASAGTYTVEVTGLCTSVTNSATLDVNENVSSSALTDVVICQNQSGTFTTVPAGTGPFTYVWKQNGNVLSGATTNTITIASADVANAGTYTVEVTGLCTAVTNSATLTVNVLTSSTDLTNLVVCPGQDATFSTITSGTGPFTYLWSKDGQTISGATDDHITVSSVVVANAGTYSVRVTGVCNSVDKSATLNVNENTSATSLTNLVLCPGQNAIFTTTATGTGPFSYAWSKDGQAIATETNAQLVLTNISAADAGDYNVHVTGGCNSVDTSATLTVNTNTTATDLTDLVLCPGKQATFATIASGTGPFGYVWKKNGNVIAGQTTNSLNIGPITATDAGTYTVEVTGLCTSVTNSATLVVNEDVVASVLTDATVCENEPVSFATTATGTGPLTYVWKKDGTVLGSATDSSISIGSAQVGDAGTYTVEVTGLCTSVTNSATLTVNRLTTATELANLVLCPGTDATFSTVVTGTGPFNFVWTKNGLPLQGFTSNYLTLTNVSSGDSATYAVHITGTCNNIDKSATLVVNTNTGATSLTSLVVCPGQSAVFTTIATGTGPFGYVWKKDGITQASTSNTLSIASATSVDAGNYTVEVTGLCTSVTNSATLTVNTNAGASPLNNLVLCPGSQAVFSTIPSGTGPFTYIWRKNGSLLATETNNTFTIASVSAIDAATYSVEVIGVCSSATNFATLVVNTNVSASGLSSVTICPGASTTFSTVATGTGPISYVWKLNGQTINGQTTSSLTIAAATTTDVGTYSVEVTGLCTSVTNSATLTLSTLAATSLPNLTNCINQQVTFATAASGVGPFTYVWKKNGGTISTATTSSYTIASLQSTDAGTYSVEVRNGCLAVTNTATLTVNQNATATALIGLTRCPGQSAIFSTAAGGTGPFAFVWKKNGTVINGQTNSALNISSVTNSDAGTYSVEVSSSCSTITNSASLNVKTNASGSALGNVVACTGQTATLSTVTSGSAPFAYRWRKNGIIISGATTSALTFTNATTNNSGTYTVEITGSCNTATNTGTLTVNPPVSIVGLSDQDICIGDSASITVVPLGGAPYTFVWRLNGSVVAGQTTNALTLTNLAVTTNGPDVVTCELYASCGNITNTAFIHVYDNSPTNGIVSVGNTQLIRINDNLSATPFPSTIYVRCVPNKLKKVTVSIYGLNHAFARDIDMLVVNPWGKALPLMAHCGGENPVSASITFDDDAPAMMPYNDAISGGYYKPSDYWSIPAYNLPAPAPNSARLSDLAADSPGGTWQLFVQDDSVVDDGNIFGGWALTLYYTDFVQAKFINTKYLNDGTFQTTLVGNDGLKYQIQSSTNLLNWTPVIDTTVPGGSYTLTVPLGATANMKFYRAIQIP